MVRQPHFVANSVWSVVKMTIMASNLSFRVTNMIVYGWLICLTDIEVGGRGQRVESTRRYVVDAYGGDTEAGARSFYENNYGLDFVDAKL